LPVARNVVTQPAGQIVVDEHGGSFQVPVLIPREQPAGVVPLPCQALPQDGSNHDHENPFSFIKS
jgi:hypothetical protein